MSHARLHAATVSIIVHPRTESESVERDAEAKEATATTQWFEELSVILERNRTVASAAKLRAVQDANEGLCTANSIFSTYCKIELYKFVEI